MEPEVYFIRYAYPCSHILCTVRGEITKEEFKQMEDAAIHGGVLDREFLEKVFFRAFERIKDVARDMHKEMWDVDVIREYFTVRHNPVLDNSDYPESFKEQCKTHKGEVIEVLENNEVIVAYNNNNKKRKVKQDYFSNLKVGDLVIIHWNYVVEKI